jgi:REP-associated tyrosine transposase
VPWGLKRFHESGQTHFITFTCFHRFPLLDSSRARRTFEVELERVRRKYQLYVYGYVVMPEHVHLLLSEPERSDLAQAIKSLKQGVARRLGGPFKPGVGLSGSGQTFWQQRYYDHNVRNYESFVAKLRYIHRNPVKRDLCNRPEDWEWSSFRHYATGVEGIVEIESQWTASRRERAGVFLRVRELPRLGQNRA